MPGPTTPDVAVRGRTRKPMKQYPPQWAPPEPSGAGYTPTYYPQDRRRLRDPALVVVLLIAATLVVTAVVAWSRY